MRDDSTRAGESSWRPTLSSEGPRYRALADAIAAAVADGALAPGDRLPPVRRLAWSLGVTPGTVARAYQLAETRGVVEGRVGSGTFACAPRDVRASALAPPAPAADLPASGRAIDLRLNIAVDVGQDATIAAALERLLARRRPAPLTALHRFGEDLDERAAGRDWLVGGGVPARLEDLVLTVGAQAGVTVALAATCGGGAGAVALTEPLIHPGLKDAARVLGVRLEPVAVDDEGLEPAALDAACARLRPGAILLSATNQNPLVLTMSAERRARIAAVALARRVAIVEDDVYGWLGDRAAPSFAGLAPSLAWYVTSPSKCVASGLRIGYLLAPTGEGARAARIVLGLSQAVSWLSSALAAELLRSGDVTRIIAEVRLETARRTLAVEAALTPALQAGLGRLRRARTTTIAWLELPDPWRASEFADAARRAGVLISPAEAFAVGRAAAPHAVRLAFGWAPSRASAAEGARRLADLLVAGPEADGAPA